MTWYQYRFKMILKSYFYTSHLSFWYCDHCSTWTHVFSIYILSVNYHTCCTCIFYISANVCETISVDFTSQTSCEVYFRSLRWHCSLLRHNIASCPHFVLLIIRFIYRIYTLRTGKLIADFLDTQVPLLPRITKDSCIRKRLFIVFLFTSSHYMMHHYSRLFKVI